VARQRYPGIESDGRRRILAGETSIEEVMRVTSIA
jgi:general secretion pathway protein E